MVTNFCMHIYNSIWINIESRFEFLPSLYVSHLIYFYDLNAYICTYMKFIALGFDILEIHVWYKITIKNRRKELMIVGYEEGDGNRRII